MARKQRKKSRRRKSAPNHGSTLAPAKPEPAHDVSNANASKTDVIDTVETLMDDVADTVAVELEHHTAGDAEVFSAETSAADTSTDSPTESPSGEILIVETTATEAIADDAAERNSLRRIVNRKEIAAEAEAKLATELAKKNAPAAKKATPSDQDTAVASNAIQAIEANSEVLSGVVSQMDGLRELIASATALSAATIDSANVELGQLRAQVTQLQGQLTNAERNNAKLETQYDAELTTQKRQAEEVELLRQQVIELQQHLDDAKLENEELAAQPDLSDETARLREQIMDLEERLHVAEQLNVELESQPDFSDEAEQLRQQVIDFKQQLDAAELRAEQSALNQNETGQDETGLSQIDQEEIGALHQQIADFQQQVDDLTQQNAELSDELAGAGSQHSSPAQSAPSETLTWEERKELMVQQMEDDSFDAESFIADLQPTVEETPINPVQYVENLHAELQLQQESLAEREKEVIELRVQLEEAESQKSELIAVPGNAEVDEILRKERDHIEKMQREWEARFRDGEIKASLERAKISRERCELAQKNAELKEQLAHFRRETEENRKAGVGGSRRWAAKLGLTRE